MNGYLLDTHIWYWYLAGSPKLSAKVRDAIEQPAAELWFSPVSVWELGMLASRGRIEIDVPFRRWITRALTLWPLKEAALNLEIALKSQEVDLPHQDPADRFIAATALIFNLTLVTVDKRLVAVSWLPTILN